MMELKVEIIIALALGASASFTATLFLPKSIFWFTILDVLESIIRDTNNVRFVYDAHQ